VRGGGGGGGGGVCVCGVWGGGGRGAQQPVWHVDRRRQMAAATLDRRATAVSRAPPAHLQLVQASLQVGGLLTLRSRHLRPQHAHTATLRRPEALHMQAGACGCVRLRAAASVCGCVRLRAAAPTHTHLCRLGRRELQLPQRLGGSSKRTLGGVPVLRGVASRARPHGVSNTCDMRGVCAQGRHAVCAATALNQRSTSTPIQYTTSERNTPPQPQRVTRTCLRVPAAAPPLPAAGRAPLPRAPLQPPWRLLLRSSLRAAQPPPGASGRPWACRPRQTSCQTLRVAGACGRW
jgi:hypothetical protein